MNDSNSAGSSIAFVISAGSLAASYNSAASVPFNVSAEEHGITATLIHRFTSAMQGTLKYGWWTLSDDTYGGRNDYEAHMLFSSFRNRF